MGAEPYIYIDTKKSKSRLMIWRAYQNKGRKNMDLQCVRKKNLVPYAELK